MLLQTSNGYRDLITVERVIGGGKIMNRRGSEATSVRDQMRISENELYDIMRIAKVGL
jgi:hypothetical protein